MSDDLPDRSASAFDDHEAFERHGDGFAVTTTRLEGTVTVEDTDGHALRYTVTVRLPMLSSVVEGEVGTAVEEGWFETLERRLPDAPKATRVSVELDEFSLEAADGDAVATFAFSYGSADRAPDVVKTIVEYSEGTYVEGVVPGYDYGDPVAEMLGEARQGDDGDTGPMPL